MSDISDSEFEQVSDLDESVSGEDAQEEEKEERKAEAPQKVPPVMMMMMMAGEDPSTLLSAESSAAAPYAEQNVVVELPPSMVAAAWNHTSGLNTTTTDQCSTSSYSFVNKMGSLNIGSNKNGCDDDEESWSHASRYNSSSVASTAPSVAASSVISGFDVLSLNGSSKSPCRTCSFLNSPGSNVCTMCGVALLANPCLDIDEQIAMNLQLKEEQLAFEAVQLEEKKRKSLSREPLLYRSQVLANSVIAFVKGYRGHGFSTFPEASLVVLASRFTDLAESSVAVGDFEVSLAYHFSIKLGWRMDQIRIHGLGYGAKISTDMEAAFKNPGNDMGYGAKVSTDVEAAFKNSSNHRKTGLKGTTCLPSIPEGSPNFEDIDASSNCLGWIVARVRDRRVPAMSGFDTIETLECSDQSLPLVCFDASLRNDDIIRSLFNGLSQICFDFFEMNESDFDEQEQIEAMIEADARLAKKQRKDEEEIAYEVEGVSLLNRAQRLLWPVSVFSPLPATNGESGCDDHEDALHYEMSKQELKAANTEEMGIIAPVPTYKETKELDKVNEDDL